MTNDNLFDVKGRLFGSCWQCLKRFLASSLLHFVQSNEKNRPSSRFLPCKLRKESVNSRFFAASSAKNLQVQQAPTGIPKDVIFVQKGGFYAVDGRLWTGRSQDGGRCPLNDPAEDMRSMKAGTDTMELYAIFARTASDDRRTVLCKKVNSKITPKIGELQ